ncbi:MAG: hypothetical protein ACUVTL_04820 [Thermoproteota archaeon]
MGRKAAQIVGSASLFLSLIHTINLLKITYYPVFHRMSYEKTIHIVLFSNWLDSVLIIFISTVASFLMILKLGCKRLYAVPILIVLNLSAILAAFNMFDIAMAMLIVGTSAFILIGAFVMKMAIAITEGIIAIYCIIEAGSLIYWFIYPLALPSQITDMLSRLSSIEAQLFYAPADLTPIAMLVLLFSLPLSLSTRWFRKKDDMKITKLEICIDGRVLLVGAIILTTLITSYPYLPSINPSGKYVGTDIYYYSEWLGQMDAYPNQATQFAIKHGSSRPLFLLLLFYLNHQLKIQTIIFLEWLAVPIFCLLTFSVFLFGFVIRDCNFAGLAALLSSFSINVVAGMYTAYYSNVLALSLLYIALPILILSIKRGSYLLVLPSCALSIITIFIHPWTWAFLLAAIFTFVLFRMIFIIKSHEGSVKLRQIGPAIAFIVANVLADQIKTLLLVVPSASGISYELAGGTMNLNELSKLWFNLYFTFRIFAGGYFNNLSAVISAIAGAWLLARENGPARDLILAWLSISALPTLFVNFWVNERIFYNLPIQLLSTAGIYYGLPRLSSSRILGKMLLLLFVFLNINYALRSMINLV